MLRGSQNRRYDRADHLVHHGEQSRVIALQGRQHHAGRKRVDRAQTLQIEAPRDSHRENGGSPGRVAAVHHEKQRGERERRVSGRATVAAGREVGEERAVGLEEVEDEGVALAKHQKEIVEVEKQGEDALEGFPVEGSVGERRKRGDRVVEDRGFGGHFAERSVAVKDGLEATGEIGEELAMRGGRGTEVLEIDEIIGEKKPVADGFTVGLERGEKQQKRLHAAAERLRERGKQRVGIVLFQKRMISRVR